MRIIIAPIIVILLSACNVAWASLHYATPLGQERWQVSSSRLKCALSHPIKNYGNAAFVQTNAESELFYLKTNQPIEGFLKGAIYRKTPPWKVVHRVERLMDVQLNNGKEPLVLPRLRAKQLLHTLIHGDIARLKYRNENKAVVRVDLSGVRFQKAYTAYTQCVGKLLPFVFADVAMSRVYFGFDSDYLTPTTKRQLDRIVEYVKADSSVSKVKVAGFTDRQGRASHNRYLSERRAKAVHRYLLNRGVSKRVLRITWYGVRKAPKKPTPQDKIQQRKVEIRIFR